MSNPSQSVSAFLDKNGLFGLATQLRRLHSNLSLKYGQAVPSVPELAVALYCHMKQSDEKRLKRQETSFSLASPSQSPSPPFDAMSSAPRREDLIRYLKIASSAYGKDSNELKSNVRRLTIDISNFDPSPVITHCVTSGTYLPAYFLVFDNVTQTLILCLRGSQEFGDLVTNLMADRVEFLDGRHAHRGVAESARNLHKIIRPKLAVELTKRNPRGGLVVTGHSLGAAVGAALTLLLRRNNPFSFESEAVTYHLRRTKCYSFSPPPFLTAPSTYRTAADEDNRAIICLVNGYDIVPRLSLNSVHRLVNVLATLDYSPTVQGVAERTTQSIAEWFVPKEEANNIAKHVSEVAIQADAVLLARAARATATVVSASSSNWSVLADFVHSATHWMGHGVEQHTRRVRTENNESGASHGVNVATGRGSGENEGREDDVNGVKEEDEMVLVGDIWHLDRDFSEPEAEIDWQTTGGEEYQFPRSRLVKRDATFFKDIETCTWMKYDHRTGSILPRIFSLTN